jgi:hypothetical protein
MNAKSLVSGALIIGCSFMLGCSHGSDVSDGGPPPVVEDSGGGSDVEIVAQDASMPEAGKRGCSSDLQAVVDENGTLVEQCSPDQGCSNGTCIEACQAAADAKGSIGCKYVVSTPSFSPITTQPCFAMFVANNWGKDALISVKRDGTTFDVTTFGRIPDGTNNVAAWLPIPKSGLPIGKVAVLFLSASPTSKHPTSGPMTCPVTPAVNAITNRTTTARGQAFEVSVNVPITAYDIIPFGGARSFLPSAQLLLPTTAWGNNFIAVTPLGTGGAIWGQIIAQEDNTSVDIVPPIDLLGNGFDVDDAYQNVKTTFALKAGEFIHWQLPLLGPPTDDISGTIISSNKPIAFVGGQTLQCLKSATTTGGGCDSSHQVVPPIQALGNEYAIAPYTTRRADLMEESIVYRVVGSVDGTTLTYDPPTIKGPTTLALGEVKTFEATGSFVIQSQDDKHPFYIGQGMSGCYTVSGSRPGITQPPPFNLPNCLGDEDYLVTLPPAQYLAKYVFFTDPTYATTNLVLTRVKTSSGFKDVTVDCVGKVTGWKPMGSGGKYEYANVDLVRANMASGTCTNGGQVAKSDGPFGVTVWGEDAFASYGYPAGGNVGLINTVVVPPNPH